MGYVMKKKWVPFLKRIITNEDVMNKLSLFYPYKGNNDKSPKDCVKRIISGIISEFE